MNKKIEELGITTSGRDIGSRRSENTERTEIKMAQNTHKKNQKQTKKEIQINQCSLSNNKGDGRGASEGCDSAAANAECTLSQNHVTLLPRLAKHAGRIKTSPRESKRRRGGRGRTGQAKRRSENYECRVLSDRRDPTEPMYWRSNRFSPDPTYYSTPLPGGLEHSSSTQTVRMYCQVDQAGTRGQVRT